MTEMRRFGPADFLLLLLVLAVAAGARAGYLVVCADHAGNEGPLRVQDAPPPLKDFEPEEGMRGGEQPTAQDLLIHNVHHHNSFATQTPLAAGEEVTAHTSPGYPYLVGLLSKFLEAGRVDVAVRWAQCALGALTAGLYFLFARRAFRSLTVGLVAGLAAGLHPFWVIGTATLDDGVLAAFLLGLALFLGARAVQEGGPLESLLYGLTLAGLALVRAALLPFAFVALVWFLLRSRSLPRGWLAALLAFLGFANGLAPWAVRNYQVFGEPVPVVDSAYLHLWAGNNPHATGGPATAEAWASAPAEELREAPRQTERYARLGPAVREEVTSRPAQALERRGRAALYFFLGEGWFHGTLAEPTGVGELPGRLGDGYPVLLQATLLGLLLLALLGWRWSYGWQAESMPAELAMLWVPLPYVLGHADWLSGPRLPLDGVLICFAAFALACLVPGVGGRLLLGAGARRE